MRSRGASTAKSSRKRPCAPTHAFVLARTDGAQQLLRLREALALVETRVLDHLIVAGSDVVSLAERGVL
jgi:hypothetical protein